MRPGCGRLGLSFALKHQRCYRGGSLAERFLWTTLITSTHSISKKECWSCGIRWCVPAVPTFSLFCGLRGYWKIGCIHNCRSSGGSLKDVLRPMLSFWVYTNQFVILWLKTNCSLFPVNVRLQRLIVEDIFHKIIETHQLSWKWHLVRRFDFKIHKNECKCVKLIAKVFSPTSLGNKPTTINKVKSIVFVWFPTWQPLFDKLFYPPPC